MSHNTEFTIFWEIIWLERFYIPIYFGWFDSEISDLKKIHANEMYFISELPNDCETFLAKMALKVLATLAYPKP